MGEHRENVTSTETPDDQRKDIFEVLEERLDDPEYRGKLISWVAKRVAERALNIMAEKDKAQAEHRGQSTKG